MLLEGKDLVLGQELVLGDFGGREGGYRVFLVQQMLVAS